MSRGRYIVLEGPEGVGKTTQLHELARRLRAAGLPVRVLREPDSQSDLTARAIRQLTQDPHYPMNTRTEVLLYNAARAQSLQVIQQSVQNGVICLVDRNYLTTLAIQYYGRGDVPDYNVINGIINFAVGGVEPDLCMVLDAPVTILRERLKHRNNGERFDDLDDAFLERVRAGYLWEARQRGLSVIFATDDPATIADNIWKLVSDNLAVRDPKAGTVSEPASVGEIIKNRNNPALAPEATPVKDVGSEAGNTQEVSSLLAAKIAASRELDIDLQPQTDGYFVPSYLKDDVKKQYVEAMDTIFEMRQAIAQKLAGHDDPIAKQALQAILPLAAKTSIAISDSTRNKLVTKLISDGLPEARQLADDSVKANDYQAVTSKAISEMAQEYLPDNHAVAPSQPVALVDYWPKNELLLVPDMLYEHSNLPLEQLQSAVNDWPYAQKCHAFKTYIGNRKDSNQRPGRALEKAHYSWDILCDFATLSELLKYRYVDDLSWQHLTPRYGYEVPQIIEEAGLTDQFEACFDISLKLHSLLQKEGYTAESEYAVLMGHKLRCKVTYNSRTAFRIHESTGGPASYQHLVQQMHEKMAEVHPLLSESMVFAGLKEG